MTNTQVLTYSLRLPDAAQTDALRLLDASRAVVNQTLTILWPRLDEFRNRPYPQAPGTMPPPSTSPASASPFCASITRPSSIIVLP